MINGMREHGLQDPKFGIYEQFFRVVLWNKPSELKPIDAQDDLNERQRKALEFLKNNKSLKTKMYMKLNNISFGTARAEINEMITFGYLKKVAVYQSGLTFMERMLTTPDFG